MHPVAFTVAGHPIRCAGLLYVLSVIVAGLFAYRVAGRRGWDTDAVLPGVALVVAAAYLGARLQGAMGDWDRFAAQPVGELLRPGAVGFFGGLALGSVAMIVYLRLAKLPLGETADALAPIAPLLYAMFRLGCFLNGDDYGLPTSMPWGMTFPDGSPPTNDRVHPTQLYEMALMVPLGLVLRKRVQAKHAGGEVAFALCALMGTERFAVEFWRSGVGGPYYLALPQWFAVGLIAFGSAGLGLLKAKRRIQ